MSQDVWRQLKDQSPQDELLTKVPNPDVVVLLQQKAAKEAELQLNYQKGYTDLVNLEAGYGGWTGPSERPG